MFLWCTAVVSSYQWYMVSWAARMLVIAHLVGFSRTSEEEGELQYSECGAQGNAVNEGLYTDESES